MRRTSRAHICIVILSFDLIIEIIHIQNVSSLEGKVEGKVPKGALIWGINVQQVKVAPDSL